MFESLSAFDAATIFRVCRSEARQLGNFGAVAIERCFEYPGWIEIGCVCGTKHKCPTPIYHDMTECPRCYVRIFTVAAAGNFRFGVFVFVIPEDMVNGRINLGYYSKEEKIASNQQFIEPKMKEYLERRRQ